MRKWSRQGFLNSADSNDDGWFKFSIRPKKDAYRIGMGIQYIIADCSNKIYLEFEPDYVALSDDGGVKDLPDAFEALKSVDTRRKKIQRLAGAVAQSAEKIEEALSDYEVKLLDAIDIAQTRE